MSRGSTVTPVTPHVEPHSVVLDIQRANDYHNGSKIHWCKTHYRRTVRAVRDCKRGIGCKAYCGEDISDSDYVAEEVKGVTCAQCEELRP